MGRYGSKEADQNYRRFIAEWASSSRTATVRPGRQASVTEVVCAYLDWAETNIDHRDYNHAKAAAEFVLDLYARTPVADFGPKSLAAVQRQMEISGRFSRGYVNKLVNHLRTIFRWGVENELVPETVANALKYVQPLRKGRTTAREVEPRQDVTDEVVDRTLPYLLPTVAAMVRVQRGTTMRPNEVCRMKVGEIDTTGEVWIYRPGIHKGAWRGHDRTVALSKPEQERIAPRLAGKGPDDAVFSPKDAVAERKERDAAKRKTKVHPSQVDRAKRHAENPKSRARDHYDSQSYARSIKYAIIRANKLLPESERIPHWTPYQLCHAALQPRRPENRDRTGEKTRRENERTRSVSRATHRTVGSLTDRIDRRQGDDVDELVGTFSTAQRALDAQVMLLTLDVAFVGDFVLFRRQVGLDAQMLAF